MALSYDPTRISKLFYTDAPPKKKKKKEKKKKKRKKKPVTLLRCNSSPERRQRSFCGLFINEVDAF